MEVVAAFRSQALPCSGGFLLHSTYDALVRHDSNVSDFTTPILPLEHLDAPPPPKESFELQLSGGPSTHHVIVLVASQPRQHPELCHSTCFLTSSTLSTRPAYLTTMDFEQATQALASVSLWSSSDVTYQPLDTGKNEIRVLVVDAGRNRDQVRCRTKVISLDSKDHIPYETISYCWGDATKRAQIILDGVRFTVPASSRMAIARVRLPDRARVIWIDAVCINQNDVDERSQQVSIMARIYSEGQTNLIYLGHDPNHVAVDTIAGLLAANHKVQVAADSLDDGEEKNDWQELWTPPKSWRMSPPLSIEELAELQPLYALSWFSRMWIFQEATLAHENICFWGRSEFAFDPILRVAQIVPFVRKFSSWREDSSGGCQSAQSWGGFLSTRMTFAALSLFTLLTRNTKHLHATNTVDYVYALGALIGKIVKNAEGMDQDALDYFTPNYRKPAADVYRDATRGLILMGHFWILEYTSFDSLSKRTQLTRASWSFPWDQQKHSLLAMHHRAGLASEHTVFTWWLNILPLQTDDPAIMTMQGFHVSHITEAQLYPLLDHTQLGQFDFAISTAKLVLLILTFHYQPLSGDRKDAEEKAFPLTASLLTAGIYDQNALRGFLDEEGDTDTTFLGAGRRPPLVQDFFETMCNSIFHRHIFKTADGQFGLGPEDMQAGDHIVIIPGCTTCHILRPMEGDLAGTYERVGPAYLPHLDNGEVFDMGLEQQLFMLR